MGSGHPMDRIRLQAEISSVVKQIEMCYMKACCELGYERVYVKQYEKGKTKDAMLEQINERHKHHISKLPTEILQRAYKFRNKLPAAFNHKELVEMELMGRIIDDA